MYVCVLGSDPEAPEEVQGRGGVGVGGGRVVPRQSGSEELSH